MSDEPKTTSHAAMAEELAHLRNILREIIEEHPPSRRGGWCSRCLENFPCLTVRLAQAGLEGKRNDNFIELLLKAGKLEMDRILESDEAFEAFLKANPLSPSEEAEVKRAVERLAARIRGRETKGKAKEGR